MAYLEFDHVSFVDGPIKVLHDISLTIDKGEFISIVGPSGSGKSTFLKLCSDLISHTEGTIMFDGKKIEDYEPCEYRGRVGYCFQEAYLFGETVEDNIKFPYSIKNKDIDMERVTKLFDLFHMSLEYLHKKNTALSGGEKQRICLIRSLLFEPEVLLVDEVTSALDQENTLLVESVLEHLHKQHGMTILMVTHNEEQSRRHVNRRITIESGHVAKWEEF